MSVCLSVTVVSRAKAAVPIEIPFGLRTRVDPRNHVLDGVYIPHAWEWRTLRWGSGGTLSAVNCAKTVELIEMPFGLWTRVGRKKHGVTWGHIGATWQIRLIIRVRRRCGLMSNYF